MRFFPTFVVRFDGELSEWLKEPASKTGVRQRTGGSNPSLTASTPAKMLAFRGSPARLCRPPSAVVPILSACGLRPRDPFAPDAFRSSHRSSHPARARRRLAPLELLSLLPGALRAFSALGNSFFPLLGALRAFSALGNSFFPLPGALRAFSALCNCFFLPSGALRVFFAPGGGFSFLSGALWLRWETMDPRRKSLSGIVVSHGPNFGPWETCGCRRGRLDHVFVSHCCGCSSDGRRSPDDGRSSDVGRFFGGADDFSDDGRYSDGGWTSGGGRERNRAQMCVNLAKNDYLEPGNQSSFRAA